MNELRDMGVALVMSLEVDVHGYCWQLWSERSGSREYMLRCLPLSYLAYPFELLAFTLALTAGIPRRM